MNIPGRAYLILVVSALLAIGFGFLIRRSRDAPRENRAVPSRDESKTAAQAQVPLLEIKTVVQHGHIFELEGLAEPGSTVMINDERVSTFGDSSFKYFVGPLPDGVTILTVTVQNEQGGVKTKQVALTLP